MEEKVSEQAITRLHNSDPDETAGIVPAGSKSFALSLRFVNLIHTFSLWPSYPINKRKITHDIKPITKTSANEEVRGKRRFKPTSKPISVASLRKKCRRPRKLYGSKSGFKNTTKAGGD
ncbi:hypothetical protein VTN00DRAFT_3826 [Thermoascus crustaceus]|uniref:uncharacterized protein n=1 Tax=Thermoascus crustaceus TaxID=5088 RepID=UPI0037424CFC